MQLDSCSVQFSQLGDPMMSLDFASNEAQPPGHGAATIGLYNRRNFGFYVKSCDAPMPKRGTSVAQEFERFKNQLLAAVDAVRSQIGVNKDFHGKAASQFNEPDLLTFRYAEGSPAAKGPNQQAWLEAWTRTPRGDFPLSVRAAVGERGGELRFRAGEFLSGLQNKIKTSARDTLHFNDERTPECVEFPSDSDSVVVDSYYVCFCFRVVAKTSRLRVLCWLHPEWPDQRLSRALPLYTRWLRKRLETAAASNYLCVFDQLNGQGDQAEVMEKIIAEADGKGEDMPLFCLAVESHSFTVADWLLEARKKRRNNQDDGSNIETPVIDSYNRWGDTALTRCCGRGGDPESIAYLLSRGADRLHQRDVTGNTAMHRLAAAIPSPADAQTVVQPVLNALLTGLPSERLAEWLAMENDNGELAMALVSNAAVLDTLLEALGLPAGCNQRHSCGATLRGEASLDCFSLLRCTSGFSVAHSFAAFGDLRAVEPVLTGRLGYDTWKQLLGSGCMRGYTPMHSACQAGNWVNVSYLMQRLDQPPPSTSALDLAIRERQLVTYDQFIDFVAQVVNGMPRTASGSAASSDAEAAALAVLDRAEDSLAVAFEDSSSAAAAKSEVTSLRLQRSSSTLASVKSFKGSDVASRNPMLGCILAAMKDDTAAPLRGLARCGAGGLQSLELQAEMVQLLVASLADLGSPGSLEGLLGLALRRHKWRLAGELLPARQVDLLPACLGVMLSLRLEMQDSSKYAAEDNQRQRISNTNRRCSTVDAMLPSELAEALYKQAKHIFCSAIQRLYRGALTEAQKGLVFNYLGGRFHSDTATHGPLFSVNAIRGDEEGSPGHSLFELMLLTQEPELLALDCATDYVDLLLASPRHFCCHRCRDKHGDRRLEGPNCTSGPLKVISSLWPEQWARLQRKLPRGCTPQISMLVFTLFNALFLALLGYYVHEVGEPRPAGRMLFLKLLLLVFGLSYSAQEFHDYRSAAVVPSSNSKQLCKRLTWYLSNRWNIVDIAAVTFLLAGLVWVIVLDATVASHDEAINGLSYYFARLSLALSFIFYCMRMLSSLSYFERLGLYISITKTTIVMDVVPFLIVNAFFLASFGVLIVCLMFPGGHTYLPGHNYNNPSRGVELSTAAYITEIFQRPLLAHFGEYDMDSLRPCERYAKPSPDSDESNVCPHPLGNKIYTRFVLFIYLLIVTVVLINVLIAKLSLTVGKEDERARVIWRRFRAQLLAEFGRDGGMPAPPLILVIVWLVIAPVRLWRRVTATGASDAADAANGNSNITRSALADSNASVATGPGGAAAGPSPGRLLSSVEKAEGRDAADGSTSSCDCDGPWWRIAGGNNRLAPSDYREFLWFQAMQFRNARHMFIYGGER